MPAMRYVLETARVVDARSVSRPKLSPNNKHTRTLGKALEMPKIRLYNLYMNLLTANA